MTPLILQLIMTALCLVCIPYLFLQFKKLWIVPDVEGNEDERKRIVRRIVIILGILGTLAFLMPLMLKFNSDYQP